MIVLYTRICPGFTDFLSAMLWFWRLEIKSVFFMALLSKQDDGTGARHSSQVSSERSVFGERPNGNENTLELIR